ncbi:MAG TPA: hypothetical protein PKD64_02650 [Pirellulaceae bacterium]|nr:hypothetical protein [Pirellulaceae bacterium]HMO91069.1 hypothetical protein [Pirellulaceae bacterium]HMP68183.1 hypothetical protein [Pirellulaceae bacterium]
MKKMWSGTSTGFERSRSRAAVHSIPHFFEATRQIWLLGVVTSLWFLIALIVAGGQSILGAESLNSARNARNSLVYGSGVGEYFATAYCPFCSSINPTVTELIETNDAVAVVKLIKQAPPADEDSYELPKATFEIVELLKGHAFVHVGDAIQAILIGNFELGDRFMILGVDPPNMLWSSASPTNDRIIEYYKRVPTLPPPGPDRLAYFQGFFEDEITALADDAYDEFALATYDDVIALKDRMNHDKLIEFIQREDVLESRKRLYFTLLGVCGTEEDVPLLERLLSEKDREKRPGLDSMAACYLRIKGEAGLPLIEKLYLSNKDAEYVDVFSIVQALRFHTTECDIIPKQRVAQAMRLVLDHAKIADIVISDLARLEDWSVVDRLAEMFRDTTGDTKWVRTPIASYMKACPKPEAKKYLAEFRTIDPDAVRRAELMANFDALDLDNIYDEESEDESDKDKSEDEDKVPGKDKDKDDEINHSVNENDDRLVEGADANEPNAAGRLDGLAHVDSGRVVPENLDVESGAKGQFISVQTTNSPENSDFDGDETEAIAVVSLKPGDRASVSEYTSTRVKTDPVSQSRPGTNMSDSPNPAVQGSARITAASGPLAETTNQSAHWSVIISGLVLASLALFVLAWSVINGWFERLIF